MIDELYKPYVKYTKRAYSAVKKFIKFIYYFLK